jgi:hypothetical protein
MKIYSADKWDFLLCWHSGEKSSKIMQKCKVSNVKAWMFKKSEVPIYHNNSTNFSANAFRRIQM